MLESSTPVQCVKGIGPRLAEILAAKDLNTVDDLLHYLPFRYEDRLNPRSVAELRPGEMATVIAEVRNSGLFRTRRMPIFQLTVGQGRTKLKCLWFNATYLQNRFQAGQMVALYGKVEQDRDGELQIIQPQFDLLGDIYEEGGADEAEKKAAASLEIGRIVPIYESTGQGKLTPRWFRRIIRWALDNLGPDAPDPIPAAVRAHLSLIAPREALVKVHWPDAGESFSDLQSSRTSAQIRLIFDELFFIEDQANLRGCTRGLKIAEALARVRPMNFHQCFPGSNQAEMGAHCGWDRIGSIGAQIVQRPAYDASKPARRQLALAGGF